MSEYKYPVGYTPMTDEELINASSDGDVNDTFVDCLRLVERAVLARLPKPDTAEREALVRRIDGDLDNYGWHNAHGDLLRDIRAYLVGG